MRPYEAGGPPDKETLAGMVRRGMTDEEIAAEYGGVDESTVRYWRRSRGVARRRAPRMDHRADGAIPWTLNTKLGHQSNTYAQLLRGRNRLAHGLSVPDGMLRRIKELEEAMAAEDVVLDYDWDEGFCFRRRDPSIDAPGSIVRVPS